MFFSNCSCKVLLSSIIQTDCFREVSDCGCNLTVLSRTVLEEINQEQNLSVRFSLIGVSVNFLQELRGLMYSLWITTGFYLWDQETVSSIFFTFKVRWGLSRRFTTLPLYADGALFLCIKPQDGCASRGFDDTIISVISASAAVTGTEQGSRR